MGRKTILLAVCLLLMFPAFLFAGEGSDTIGDGNLLLQLRYSYIDNDYETEYDDLTDGPNDHDFFSHSVYFQADYGLTDFVDVYGLIGYRYLDVDIDAGFLGTGDADDIFAGNLDALLWGVGVKSTFFRSDGGFYLGGGLSFTHAFTTTLDTGLREGPADGDDDEYTYQELNLTADLHAGWRFENGLNPYFGVEYRHTWMYLEEHDQPNDGRIEEDSSGRYEAKNNFGVYAGLDYIINDRFFLNIEGHVVDYWGVSASFGYLLGSPFGNVTLAGTGSDTVGSGNLLLQLKYAYFEDEFKSEWEDLHGSPNEFEYHSHSVYLQLHYGITDYVDIYGLLGYKLVHASLRGDGGDYGHGNFDAFLWGAGLKSTFYRADCGFYCGGGLGLTHSFTPDKQRYSWEGDGDRYYKYSEINLTTDLHAGWRFEEIGLTPYAGVEFRYTWLNHEEIISDPIEGTLGEIDEDEGGVLKPEDYVGVFVGLEYLIGDRFFLNVEGHMLNRWGGSVGFGYMF
jgi:opacity protein-like surface antigen